MDMSVQGDSAPPVPISTPRAEFIAGIKATIPLIIGAIPFGIIYGASAVVGGFSPALPIGMSALVYAGAAQFIGIELLTRGVAIGVIILTTFVVNLRHALYAATLAPYMKHLPHRWLLPLGFTLTDETFVVAVQRYQQADKSPHKHWYYAGSSLAMYVNWQFCTWVGVIAGSSIENPEQWGLDFALIVTFIGMVVPMIKDRPVFASVVVAALSAVVFNGVPNRLGLMIAAVLGVVAGVIVERRTKTPPTEDEKPSAQGAAE